jgi:hypothetical protein
VTMHTWEWVLVGVGIGLVPFVILVAYVVHFLMHFMDGI